MPRCTVCTAEFQRSQIVNDRCPVCGETVQLGGERDEAVGREDTVTQPAALDIMSTINPRDLTVEQSKSLEEIWSGTHDSRVTPRMTIKNDAGQTWGGLDLVIPARRVRKMTDADVGLRADYEIGDVVGEGGVGTVYAARQASIDRTVALKMLRSDVVDDFSTREKFLAEAVVTGELEHPNIVPVYDVGTNTRGELFYSMKLVRGTPWSEVIRQKTTSENLSILMRVCDAVAFAHASGVIHRDLKPENVMLGGFGEVVLMDWGIAIAKSLLEKHDDVRKSLGMGGTPAYMAPEMATGPLEAINAVSDVYLLGAILYEIVTGNAPHTGSSVTECLRAAARNVIEPTEKKGELIEIAYRALSTNPRDRYQSVAEFQDAIQKYRSHSESIGLTNRAEEDLSRASRTGDYQLFARTIFALEEAVSLWHENERAREGLLTATRRYAETALSKGDFDLGLSLLDESREEHAPLRKELLSAQHERDARQQRLRNVRRLAVALLMLIIVVVSGFLLLVYRQSSRLASTNDSLQLLNRDLESKRATLVSQRDQLESQKATLEDQTKRLEEQQLDLQAANRDIKRERDTAQRLTIEAQTAERRALLAKEEAQYKSYLAQIGLAAAKIEENAFADAARILSEYADSPLRHWEWGRLRYFQRLSGRTIEEESPIDSIAYAPDASRIAIGRRDGKVRIHSLVDEQMPLVIDTAGHYIFGMDFSPDGRWLATGGDSEGAFLALWNAETGQLASTTFPGDAHADWVLDVDFSADGKFVLSSSYDKTAKLWEAATCRLVRTFARHHRPVWAAAMSPDRRTIVTASEDGTAIVWRDRDGSWQGSAEIAAVLPKFAEHRGPLYAVAFSPDGSRVATAGHDKRVLLWKPDDVQAFEYDQILARGGSDPVARTAEAPFTTLEGHTAAVRALSFSGDGKRLLSGSSDNTMIVWDVDRGREIKRLRGHSDTVAACRFAPQVEGTIIASGSHDGAAKFWDVDAYSEQQVLLAKVLTGHDDAVLSADFDHTNQRIVTASRDRTARIWQLGGRDDPVVLNEGHEYLVSSAFFSPDGSKLITGAMDNSVRIWDARTGAELFELRETGTRAVAAVSSDGNWLVTGSVGDAVQVWDLRAIFGGQSPADASTQIAADGQHAAVTAAAFPPNDPHRFVIGDQFGRVVLYQRDPAATDGRFTAVWRIKPSDESVEKVAFAGDGQQIVTSGGDRVIRFWQAADGGEVAQRQLVHPADVSAFELTVDGRQLLSACVDGNLRLWDVEAASVLRTLAPAIGGPKSLAANVRRRLATLQWTAETLATESGLSKPQVARVLSGDFTPDVDDPQNSVATALATALKLDQTALLAPYTNALDISVDGSMAVSANSEDGRVRLWDSATGREIEGSVDAAGHERIALDTGQIQGAVATAIFAPDGNSIVISGGRRSSLWDLRLGVQSMIFSPHNAVASADFSPDGQWVVTGSWDGTAKIWHADSGQSIRRLTGGHRGSVNSVCFSPNGQLILTAGDDGTARLWNAGTGELLADPVFRHAGSIRAAVFSFDGRFVATVSDDGTAGVWAVDSGQPLQRLSGHRAGVLCAAFSFDNRRLITGSRDQTARIWNVATGAALTEALGHTSEINSVAFSPDGRRALTGSGDQSVKLWDAELIGNAAAGLPRMQEIMTLSGHTDGVMSVAFSPSGQEILTAGRDGTTILWESEFIPPQIALAPDSDLPADTDFPLFMDSKAVFNSPHTSDFAGFALSVELETDFPSVRLASELGRISGWIGGGRETNDANDEASPSEDSETAAAASALDESGRLFRVEFDGHVRHTAIEKLLRQVACEKNSVEQRGGRITFVVRLFDRDGDLTAQSQRSLSVSDSAPQTASAK